MGNEWKLDDFKRLFRPHGVSFGYTKSGYLKLTRSVGGEMRLYPVPLIRGRHVKEIYIRKARRALSLLPQDGYPDSAFFDHR